MVEAAKAQNPFAAGAAGATPAVKDKSNYCQLMERLGVCLEPAMCFLIHEDPEASSQVVQMSAAAKEFNPFAAGAGGAGAPSFSKEFVPVQTEAPQTAQSGMVAMLGRMGLDVQVDPELGTIFIQQFENCECCHGMINNCQGEFCAQMGMCYCVSHFFHDDEDDN